MKIEASKITKVIEQNFSHLMREFYEMQTEYLASLNIIYDDLDASLVGRGKIGQVVQTVKTDHDSTTSTSFNEFAIFSNGWEFFNIFNNMS